MDRSDPTSGRLAVLLTAALYGLLVVWGLLSDGTWDDDGPTRYFAVASAFDDPRQFVELWNRPLFVLVYVLPYQLGPLAPVFGTALATALAGLVTYLSVRRDPDDRLALVAIPFVVGQPFLFGTSSSALTEPLAALLIAVAIWAHRRGRLVPFVVAGALLPLARLELSVMLVCWLPFLLGRRALRWVPVLAVPTLLWSLAGTAFDGDPLWLVGQVFTGESNRYANTPALHYLERYNYVAGPVVTVFVVLGLLDRIRTRTLDLATSVWLFGIALYSVIAWKLSIGHPAGFLRNLVPIAPAAAFLAVNGLRASIHGWLDGVGRAWVLGGSVAVVALTAAVWSRPLVDHHFLDAGRAWPTLVVTVVAVLLAPLAVRLPRRAAGVVLPVAVSGLGLGWTLVTEPPRALTAERRIMKEMAEWYADNRVPGATLFCNHIWFFWELGRNPEDPEFGRTTQANLNAAKPGDVTIIETHYSHRLRGDVAIEYFEPRRALWTTRGSASTPDRRFAAIIFVRNETPIDPGQPAATDRQRP